jgi:hypothetical protein
MSVAMVDLHQERNHLILADRHLVEGEQRITEQLALIQRMTRQGYDTVVANDLLRLLEQTLTLWQEHRQLILEAIARHELSASSPSKGWTSRPDALWPCKAPQPDAAGADPASPRPIPDAEPGV